MLFFFIYQFESDFVLAHEVNNITKDYRTRRKAELAEKKNHTDQAGDMVNTTENNEEIEKVAPKTSKKIKEKKRSKEKEGYLKAKKDAAYAILSKATGKKVAWLKMQKNKSLEKIQNLIANVDDKLSASDFDPSWTEYYPDLNKLNDNGNESIGVDYEIVSKVLDDIINDNFYEENKYSDMTTEDFIAMTEYDIENIKSQIKTQLIKDLIKDETEITEDIFNRAYSLLNTSGTSEEYLLDFEEDINLLNEIYDNQKLLISLHEELEKTKNNIHNDNEVLNENTRRNNRRNKAKSTTNETGNNERTVNGAVSEFENGNVLRTSNNSNVNHYEQNEENITRNVKNEKSKGRKSSTKENKTTRRNDKKTLEDEIKEIAPNTNEKLNKKEVQNGHVEIVDRIRSDLQEEQKEENIGTSGISQKESSNDGYTNGIGRNNNISDERRIIEKHREIISNKYKNQYELNQAIENFINNNEIEVYKSVPEEIKDWLKKYTGAGGLEKQGAEGKGLLSEYYTPHNIVKKMWDLVKQYVNTDDSKVLEPSVGIGRFLENAPQNVNFDV